jgi:hypothetical protein
MIAGAWQVAKLRDEMIERGPTLAAEVKRRKRVA